MTSGSSWSSQLQHCRLYLCTSDRPDLEEFTAACIAGGVDIAQLRDKQLDAHELIARARTMADVCRAHHVPFIMNDRPDIAYLIDADGVHVGQDDVPASLAREIVGPDRIVGFSTHQESEIDGALLEPCDYASAGPVVATPTKPGRPGTGTGYISYATRRAREAGLPLFITGGVTPENVGSLVDAGADRFVAVRYLTESDDPERSARRLRSAIDEALAGHATDEVR